MTTPRWFVAPTAPSGPFFSPDGQHLGFFAAGQLKQVALDGGAPVRVCDAAGRGAVWAPDGTIIFTPSGNDGLWRVPASGGTPQRLTTLDVEHHERTHRFPTILPDGRTILFVAATTDIASYADAQIIAQPIAGGPRKVVVQGGTSPQFAMGQLVYNRGDALVAVPFDVGRLEVTGRPVVIATDVAWSATYAVTHAALARDGTLAYIPGGEILARKKLMWVDRTGQRTAVTDDARFYTSVRVSPDGTRLLLWDQAANDMLLVYDVARNRSSRLPLRGNVYGGAWTPMAATSSPRWMPTWCPWRLMGPARSRRSPPTYCRTRRTSRLTATPWRLRPHARARGLTSGRSPSRRMSPKRVWPRGSKRGTQAIRATGAGWRMNPMKRASAKSTSGPPTVAARKRRSRLVAGARRSGPETAASCSSSPVTT